MIIIPDFTPCGFGNKVLYYNNMRQLAEKHGVGYACPPWEGLAVFDLPLENITQTEPKYLPFCLGEKYFEWKTISTRDIFKFTVEEPPLIKNSCAVHFRGTDKFRVDKDAIYVGQKTQYYLDAIDRLKEEVNHFYIFTDDLEMDQFKAVVERLKELKLGYSFGDNTWDREYFAEDFVRMSHCDYMISSPSTFNIVAGMVGKNKKIIHSKEWLDNRKTKNDRFWVELLENQDQDYSVWELI